MKIVLLSILTAILFPLGDALILKAKSATCSGAISFPSWVLSCGGDDYCSPGDEVEPSITATLSGFEDSSVCADMDASIRVLGMNVYTKDAVTGHSIDICEDATSDSGASCPADGTYTFTPDGIKIPDFDEQKWMNLVSGSATVTFYEDDCSTQIARCVFYLKTESGSGSSSSQSQMIWSAGIGVGGAALVAGVLCRTRRRRLQTESEAQEERNFEMMQDPVYSKGVVSV